MDEGGHLIDFDQLYRELRTELLSYYRKRLPDPSQAEDFVQRSFERLLGKDEIETPRTLLYRIADGLLKNEYRDNGRDPLRHQHDEDDLWPGVKDRRLALELAQSGNEDHEYAASAARHSDVEHLPAPDFEDAVFATELDGAVRALDPDLRDAFILGELRGLTTREAGAVLDTSHETANARRVAATVSIRKELLA